MRFWWHNSPANIFPKKKSYKFGAERCINHSLVISLEYAVCNVCVVLTGQLTKELSCEKKIQLWDLVSLATCFPGLVTSFGTCFPFFLTAVSFFLFTFSFLSTFFLGFFSDFPFSSSLTYPFPFHIAHIFIFVLHLASFAGVQKRRRLKSSSRVPRHNSLVTPPGLDGLKCLCPLTKLDC